MAAGQAGMGFREWSLFISAHDKVSRLEGSLPSPRTEEAGQVPGYLLWNDRRNTEKPSLFLGNGVGCVWLPIGRSWC